MWGSLQLDWPFSLVVVVVITITSRSHRSPSTDDSKYSTPACVSVCSLTVVWFSSVCGCDFPLLMPNTPLPLLTASPQRIVPSFPYFFFSPLLLFLFWHCLSVWGDSSMVHYWLVLISSPSTVPSPSLHLNTLLKQEVEFLSCAWRFPVSSHALCAFIQNLMGWPCSLDGSVSGVPPPTLILNFCPIQLSLPVPPGLHYPLWVYCLHLIYLNPAVFSQYTVQHRTVCVCRPALLVCPEFMSSLFSLIVLYYGTENHHWLNC